MDENSTEVKQKGLGNKPSPNYYQTVVVKVLHRSELIGAKQKGLGIKPSPNYYQASEPKVWHKSKVTRSNYCVKKSRPISRTTLDSEKSCSIHSYLNRLPRLLPISPELHSSAQELMCHHFQQRLQTMASENSEMMLEDLSERGLGLNLMTYLANCHTW